MDWIVNLLNQLSKAKLIAVAVFMTAVTLTFGQRYGVEVPEVPKEYKWIVFCVMIATGVMCICWIGQAMWSIWLKTGRKYKAWKRGRLRYKDLHKDEWTALSIIKDGLDQAASGDQIKLHPGFEHPLDASVALDRLLTRGLVHSGYGMGSFYYLTSEGKQFVQREVMRLKLGTIPSLTGQRR